MHKSYARHEILLTKLHFFGIQGTRASWFRCSNINLSEQFHWFSQHFLRFLMLKGVPDVRHLPQTVCAIQKLTCMTEHYHRTPPLTVGNILTRVFFFFFSISQEISDWCIAQFSFQSQIRQSNTTWSYSKLRGKPTDTQRRVQSCSIWECSRSITFHSLPTPTSFPGTVRAVPLFYSRASYINDLPPTLHTSSIPIIFADDISVIISSKNLDDFCILSHNVLSQMSKWFSVNKLSLNLDKTNVIKFITKNSP
jgi:hypothetical protein